MSSRAAVLFYCQHSLGMGHLVRSLALADALSTAFRVVFLNGGPLPAGMRPPGGVELVALPPLGLDADGRLVSRDRRYSVERARERRREIVLEQFRSVRPEAVVIELFPFGRKKFKTELLPLLDEAKNQAPAAPLILCSLRDILVGRPDQPDHDERAVVLANRYFDAVLVHADPALARLDESFHPSTPLRIPIHYTGFVAADRERDSTAPPARARRIIVSAGGGLVGAPLLRAAIEAHAHLWRLERLEMQIIAGPFVPDHEWQALRALARGRPGLRLRRYVPDLLAELRAASGSVSQCGYNTALDILRSGVPALVVPYADGPEDEQTTRARRLEQLGAVRVLEAGRLSAESMAAEIRALLHFSPRPVALDMDGTRHTVEIVTGLLETRDRLVRATARPPAATPATPAPRAASRPRSDSWLDPLRRALDTTGEPVSFFVRDDDAGWCDERLFALLDLTAWHGVPVDVAVIPAALTAPLARRLRTRIEAMPGLVEVHQHGYAHADHEAGSRKCEFGPARSYAEQRRDIAWGMHRLAEMLGGQVRPLFTPPWNRCTAITGECLVELGFRILSRDRSAAPLALAGLAELPVGFDWFARRHKVQLDRAARGALLAECVGRPGPIGIMFHHALMDRDELHAAGELLGLLAAHSAARCGSMLAVGSRSALDTAGGSTAR